MLEFDTRKKAKENAEFITPEFLRKFLVGKVNGEKISILEPAIGSGQLLFEIKDKIEKIHGFDVNEDSVEVARKNFPFATIENKDFITSDIGTYDLTVSNYPFSLKATEEQSQAILNDEFLSQFYSKKVTGVLDFVFILKSFQASKEGLYYCFPGIGYRAVESKFRQWLIKNKYIREYGLLENCNFEHTSISILFLHLTKTPNEEVNSFRLDCKTGEYIGEKVTLEDNLNYPDFEVVKEVYDPVELECNTRRLTYSNFKKQVEMSKIIWEFTPELHGKLKDPDTWLKECIEDLKAIIA